MLKGVMLLWFLLAAASMPFVAIDIRRTPESPVLKWGFVLMTAYTGPVGAVLYVLGCREPLPGLHEQYTAARWRQTLGSTMHCVAGDGLGILAGAALRRDIRAGRLDVERAEMSYIPDFSLSAATSLDGITQNLGRAWTSSSTGRGSVSRFGSVEAG